MTEMQWARLAAGLVLPLCPHAAASAQAIIVEPPFDADIRHESFRPSTERSR